MEAAASSSPPPPDPCGRVKLLCSFGGTVLPRPLDGKLRYVGGETRILSVPREAGYADLMAKMREVFPGARLIKYQQPDDDLDDALVSIFNDEDVVNMMEEHDKVGGDGFARLRVFLFSSPQHESRLSPPSAFDADEAERRYVDALNSVSDGNNWGFPANEEFSGLRRLNIPTRYGDFEGPWSPAAGACCSPGYWTTQDFSPSSSARRGIGDLIDRVSQDFTPSPSAGRIYDDRVWDECVAHSPFHQSCQCEHCSVLADGDNVLWIPPGGAIVEKAGFPGNLGHMHGALEGNGTCEHCQMAFQRNRVVIGESRHNDPHWECRQLHPEWQPGQGVANELSPQLLNSCAECVRGREAYLLNQEINMDHDVYTNKQFRHQPVYTTDMAGNESDFLVHQPYLKYHYEEMRGHMNTHYAVGNNIGNLPCAQCNYRDGHHASPSYIGHGSGHQLHSGYDAGIAIRAGAPHIIVPLEAGTLHHGSMNAHYGTSSPHQVPNCYPSVHVSRRMMQDPMYPTSSCGGQGYVPQTGTATNYLRGTPDGNTRFSCIMGDDQFHNPGTSGSDTTAQKIHPVGAEDYYDHSEKFDVLQQERSSISLPAGVKCRVAGEAVALAGIPSLGFDSEHVPSVPTVTTVSPSSAIDPTAADSSLADNNFVGEFCKIHKQEIVKGLDASDIPSLTEKKSVGLDSSGHKLVHEERTVRASGRGEQIKASAHASDVNASFDPHQKKDSSPNDAIHMNSLKNLKIHSNEERPITSKIEPTTAEEEALAKGLQTIKNDDLEIMRELGTGTFGSVYHGKWRGSDVAIKRIKASCFLGRPSERERLIADFWKETLILSSLHHPNVVSFYGVVRDGPDGSLATVTEFMVNGSLKQFLQKKDRTIDRRKRLILAMDVACGMEYLHEKNIVHFDLKCENLLVNMRDPHRPVCKIGDLGLSKVKQHTFVSGGVRGTLPWMAPELLSGKSNKVTEKVDVYSFGMVMWELLTGEEPYADMDCASIIGGIINGTLCPHVPAWCDPEWKSLMESCWSSDPEQRPSFFEISQKLRKMSAAINVK